MEREGEMEENKGSQILDVSAKHLGWKARRFVEF